MKVLFVLFLFFVLVLDACIISVEPPGDLKYSSLDDVKIYTTFFSEPRIVEQELIKRPYKLSKTDRMLILSNNQGNPILRLMTFNNPREIIKWPAVIERKFSVRAVDGYAISDEDDVPPSSSYSYHNPLGPLFTSPNAEFVVYRSFNEEWFLGNTISGSIMKIPEFTEYVKKLRKLNIGEPRVYWSSDSRYIKFEDMYPETTRYFYKGPIVESLILDIETFEKVYLLDVDWMKSTSTDAENFKYYEINKTSPSNKYISSFASHGVDSCWEGYSIEHGKSVNCKHIWSLKVTHVESGTINIIYKHEGITSQIPGGILWWTPSDDLLIQQGPILLSASPN